MVGTIKRFSFVIVLWFVVYIAAMWLLYKSHFKRPVNPWTNHLIQRAQSLVALYPLPLEDRFPPHKSSQHTNYLLCITFLACDSNAAFEFDQRTKKSLTNSQNFPDKRLVLVEGALGALEQNISQSIFNHFVRPKILMLLQAEHLFKSYRRVWTMDDDISFSDFDAPLFFAHLECADWPSEGPLVAQPVVAENTQTYTYLNEGGWRNHLGEVRSQSTSRSRTESGGETKGFPLLSYCGFVEIQVPVFDAAFLRWYLKAIVRPLTEPAVVLGSDWGFDSTFCRAAEWYAKGGPNASLASLESQIPLDKVHESWGAWGMWGANRFGLWSRTAATSSSVASDAGAAADVAGVGVCAVLPAHRVHHADKRSTNAVLGKHTKVMLGKQMMAVVEAAFPSLFCLGTDDRCNPLSTRFGSRYKKIYTLVNVSCPLAPVWAPAAPVSHPLGASRVGE